MINFDFDKDCYSCGLCETSCPTQAITFKPNVEASLVPNVAIDLCINCGKCDRICPHLNPPSCNNSLSTADAYAAYNKDEKVRLASSSGGLFKLLADLFIKNGDYVCGCVWDNQMLPVHIVSNKPEDILKMMGSKYIGSIAKNCYEEIKHLLKANHKVLFTGTPCQLDALYRYVGSQPNLYTMGVICHGVAIPSIWKQYLEKLENQYGKVINYKFRDKTLGWTNFFNKITFASNKTICYNVSVDALYMKAFLKGFILRERCFSCTFKGDKMKADLLVGDFWELPKKYNQIDDDKGLSCILVLSNQGRFLFEQIKSGVHFIPVEREEIFKGNQNLLRPYPKPLERDAFIAEIEAGEKDLYTIFNNYVKPKDTYNRIKLSFKKLLFKLGIYKPFYKLSRYLRKRL